MAAFVGSGRPLEGGILIPRLSDFKEHYEGEAFRHTADQIDVTQLSNYPSSTTLQSTLEVLADGITAAGSGFISIGTDGYESIDGYSPGTFTVGSTDTPTIEAAFTAAFAHPRLSNGGIILLMAGTYTVTNTITVPAGISIMGEISGTILVSQTTEHSMFKISSSLKYPSINAAGSVASEEATDSVKMFNMVLTDGYGTSANPTMITVPMIAVERGANFTSEQVTYLGRLGVLGASPGYGRTKTLNAIGVLGTGSSRPTNVTVTNCVFDGHKVPIAFVAGGSGELVIDSCRARSYGSDTPAGTAADNCFAVFDGGTVKATNNYHLGAGKNVFASFVYNGGGTAVSLVLIGNSGSPSPTHVDFPNSGSKTKFFVNATPSTASVTSIISGNTWGTTTNNGWAISIGDGTNSIGDLTGEFVLDTLAALYVNYSSDNTIETIFVNPGTYTITGSSYSNFKLIGNKNGINYPVIQVSITDGDQDYLGQKFVGLGNYLKSLKFVSLDERQSVIVGVWDEDGDSITNGNVVVDDCIFEDTSLIYEALVTNDSINPILTTQNCQFNDTLQFTPSLALLTQPSIATTIDGCSFINYAYAITITRSYGIADYTDGVIKINNITAINSTNEPNIDSPLGSDYSRYLYIGGGGQSLVSINNSYIVAAAADSAIDETYTRACEISALKLTIDNCIFQSETAEFVSSSIDYSCPVLWAQASQNFNISNSLFYGGLPLQLSGGLLTYAADSGAGPGMISNCDFVGLGMTCLDIDFDHDEEPDGYTLFPEINVENCNFHQAITSSSNLVLHYNNTDSFYNTSAIVQIYAGQTTVNFNNNKVNGNLYEIPGGLSNYAGVVINTSNLDEYSAQTDEFLGYVNVDGNIITVRNTFDSNSDENIVCSLMVTSAINNIKNNYLAMNNYGFANLYPTCNVAGCLYLNQTETANGYAQGVISGNIFSNKDVSGSSSYSIAPNKYTSIVILGGGSGLFVDNAFSSLLVSQSSVDFGQIFIGDGWVIDRNKNLQRTLGIRAVDGRHNLNNTDAGVYVLDGYLASAYSADGIIAVSTSYESGALLWSPPTVVEGTFSWILPLQEILPIGANILTVTCLVTVGPVAVIAGTGSQNVVTMQFQNSAAFTTTSTINFKAVTSGTLSLSPDGLVPITPATTTPYAMPQLKISAPLLKSSGNPLIIIQNVIITYTW